MNADSPASHNRRFDDKDSDVDEHLAKRRRLSSPPPTLGNVSSERPDSDKSVKEPVSSSKTNKSRQRSDRPDRNKTKSTAKQKGWERSGDEEVVVDEEACGPKAPRLPKRQTALLLGFCGTGCSGMQFQPNVRTIEGVLFDAMIKAGAVSQDNSDNPTKVNFARAARTDAGVHAAGNLVSLKMITEIPGVDDVISRINQELPEEVCVWGYARVQNSFNARTLCDSRKYTYFFPTYLLLPPKPGNRGSRPLDDHRLSTTSFWSTDILDSTATSDLERKRRWRISTTQVDRLRETASKFIGSHNFHNFTVGRDFNDRSCVRYIIFIEISEPAIYNGTEWMSLKIHGQSFMLHQIRKMMSVLILSCRYESPAKIIDELYGPRTVFVPKMPSLGLLLEYPIFDSYNRRIESQSQLDPSNPDYRPKIQFEDYREQMDAFKEKHIYAAMRRVEDQNGLFDEWIRSIDAYAGKDLSYLNANGSIPDEAVIEKHGKRANAFREKRKFDITGYTTDGQMVDDDGEIQEDKLDKKQLTEMEG